MHAKNVAINPQLLATFFELIQGVKGELSVPLASCEMYHILHACTMSHITKWRGILYYTNCK